MAKGNEKTPSDNAQTNPETPNTQTSNALTLQEASEKITDLEKTLQGYRDNHDRLTQEKNSLSGQVIMLTNEKSTLTTKIEEREQAIEDLRSQMDKAAADAKSELDQAMQSKDEELNALLSWKSRHSLKIMGATVGTIIVIAGTAYLVKRFLLTGESTEVDGITAETDAGTVELELVSNY